MVARSQYTYESDDSTTHPIFLTADYAAAAGTAATGTPSSNIICKVSKTKREYGLGPRGVRAGRTVGTAGDEARKYVFVPVFTATAWGTAAYDPGATITIGGNTYTVTSRVPEDY